MADLTRDLQALVARVKVPDWELEVRREGWTYDLKLTRGGQFGFTYIRSLHPELAELMLKHEQVADTQIADSLVAAYSAYLNHFLSIENATVS